MIIKGGKPIQKTFPYSRGWEDKGYSIKEGYDKILELMRGYQTSTKWYNVWNRDSLPKINFFIWTLVHDKILRGEKLMKRGFHGPFIYPICQNSPENISHLFLECSFARKFWTLTFGDLVMNIRWSSSPHPSLGNWDKYYRGFFKDKPTLKCIWRAMPMFICW